MWRDGRSCEIPSLSTRTCTSTARATSTAMSTTAPAGTMWTATKASRAAARAPTSTPMQTKGRGAASKCQLARSGAKHTQGEACGLMWTLAVRGKGVVSVCLPLSGCWMFAGSRLQRTVRRAWRRQNESTTWIRCAGCGANQLRLGLRFGTVAREAKGDTNRTTVNRCKYLDND